MDDTPRRLQVKFAMPSDPRYLPVVRGAIGPLAAVIGWDETECGAITLAVDEAPSQYHPARLPQPRRRAD
jgi:hypothetical protein